MEFAKKKQMEWSKLLPYLTMQKDSKSRMMSYVPWQERWSSPAGRRRGAGTDSDETRSFVFFLCTRRARIIITSVLLLLRIFL
jgi:hypothetical protein